MSTNDFRHTAAMLRSTFGTKDFATVAKAHIDTILPALDTCAGTQEGQSQNGWDTIYEDGHICSGETRTNLHIVAWMDPEHAMKYGIAGLCWANEVQTEHYSVPLYASGDYDIAPQDRRRPSLEGANPPSMGRPTVERVECVSGIGTPADPVWRIEIDGFCADFETETAANNFAAAIAAWNRRAPDPESASRIEALEKALRDETGWVLEHSDSPTSAPRYWAAGQVDPLRSSAWTENHMAAIRFARSVDAQAVADRLMKKAGVAVRVCEHQWMGSAVQ